MKRVVILNAPPACGKDTIADLMVKHLKATKHEFKHALYQAFADYYDMPLDMVLHICTHRDIKDTLVSSFSSYYKITPRQGLIHVSEDVYKPEFGTSYFGYRAAESLVEGVNAFSDGGGWWDELTPVVERAEQTIICRLYRPFYDFENDSRDYYNPLTMPKCLEGKVTICDIHLQEGKPYAALDLIAEKVKEIYNKLVGGVPLHASPFENQATPCRVGTEKGNFTGWAQYRRDIENETTQKEI